MVKTILVIMAVVVGWTSAGLVLAMALGSRLRDSSDELATYVAPRVSTSSSARGLGVPGPRRTRWALPGALVAMMFAGSTGLATAGALPTPVQGVAHSVLRTIGVDVPTKRTVTLREPAPQVAAPSATSAAPVRRSSTSTQPSRSDRTKLMGESVLAPSGTIAATGPDAALTTAPPVVETSETAGPAAEVRRQASTTTPPTVPGATTTTTAPPATVEEPVVAVEPVPTETTTTTTTEPPPTEEPVEPEPEEPVEPGGNGAEPNRPTDAGGAEDPAP